MSVFGTDFICFAKRNPIIGHLIRKTLKRTKLLIADNSRDARLAHVWGLPADAVVQVMPVSGGIEFDIFKSDDKAAAKHDLNLNPEKPVVICLRGFSGSSVYTDTLIKAVPQILKYIPGTTFVVHGRIRSAGGARLRGLVKDIGVADNVLFLDIPTTEVPRYLQASNVIVSPTSADGTPMSMLEGMACGCVPVMSNLDSIREWVIEGYNGFLFEYNNTASLISALKKALNCEVAQIVGRNADLLKSRANMKQNMSLTAENYRSLTSQ